MSLAVPEKEGSVFADGDGGVFSLTVAAFVSTTNVTGALIPGAPFVSLGCSAMAVNVWRPLGRAGEASFEVHAPPVPCALAVATIVPWGNVPSKISIVTSVLCVAVPVNEGVV